MIVDNFLWAFGLTHDIIAIFVLPEALFPATNQTMTDTTR